VKTSAQLQPIPFWHTLVLFGIPGAIVYVDIYFVVPYLVRAGVPLVLCFPPLLMLPVLLPAALVLLGQEGNKVSWSSLRERFRLHPMSGKQWLWALGTLFAAQVSDGLFGFIGLDWLARWLATIPVFGPPKHLPALMDPRVELDLLPTEFLGAPLRGNWWILLWWVALLFLSNLGEELVWRGYVLPRQELSLGRSAWVVNGLLWTFLVHAVLKWQYIGMLPSMLLAPWLAQKARNTWASFVVHYGGNLMIVALLVPGIVGAS
jgi:membrane protease YdiL (CAAX protease family)